MVEGFGDAAQQVNVDVVLAENLVHVRAGAADVVGQLRGRHPLLSHYLFYMLPDVHEKAWNLFNLSAIGFPRPPYQQVIPRHKKMASHNGFLIRCLE